jgi:hypothetical protein
LKIYEYFQFLARCPKQLSHVHLLLNTSNSAVKDGTTGLYHFSKVLRTTGQHFKMGIDNLELLGICDYREQ